jgi:cell division protein FtsA
MMKRRAVIDFESAYQRWKGIARRGNGDTLLIVDVGHSTVKALLAKIGPAGEVMVLDYASCYNHGVNDGAVTDAARFAAAIERAVTEMRRRNGVRSKRLELSISAPFISYLNHFTTVKVPTRRRVTQRMIEIAVRRARDEISSLVEHVMQVVPVRYSLDSIYSGSEPPLGMRGEQLGIEITFVTAPLSALEQIEKALKACGYAVNSWSYSGLSAAQAVLGKNNEAGVAVIDIGGNSTDVAVFAHGKLLHMGVVAGGGRDFDSDLAIFLNESMAVAQDVKHNFGCALPQVIRYNEVIDLKERGLGVEKLISAREVATVLRDRAQELLYAVGQEISKGLALELLSRVILTGGCARLAGLPELAEIVLDRNVEVGQPRAVNGTLMGFSDPGCSALVGTLRLIRKRILASRRMDTAGMTSFEKFRCWLGALVGVPVAEGRELV